MNKHEIEALRGLIAQWRKQAEEYFSEGDELGSAASNDDANDLEKLLDSLPAPDDGLPIGPSHPEAKCHDCGGDNVVWFAPNILWNKVIRNGKSGSDPMLCPSCFLLRAEKQGISEVWKICEEDHQDDGLREGLGQMVEEWKESAAHLRACNLPGGGIEDCADMLEKLLAKTPDGWKPIADAPRDGREIIGWQKMRIRNNEKFIKWNENKNAWVDRDFNEWINDSFSHYREKPAPPREGKG